MTPTDVTTDPRSAADAAALDLARGMTISDQIARHARLTPDAIAFRFEDDSRTYAEMDARADLLASALTARGVGVGDRVAVLGLNGLEMVEAFVASVRLGAIGVPVNFRLAGPELAYILSDSGASAAIVDGRLLPVFADGAARAPFDGACLVVGAAPADAVDAVRGEDYDRVLASADAFDPRPVVDLMSPAFIMYTSGTTGSPKGAVLTHYNLLMHAFHNIAHMGSGPDDTVGLSGAPLFHIAGLAGMLPTILRGGQWVVTPSGQFDAAQTVDLLERERVSSCFYVPTQWEAIVALPGIADRDLSSLRRLAWGAAPASTTLLRKMIDTFPQAEVTTAFGQTECSPVTCILRGEDSVRKIGSVGTPLLGVEVRVVDDEMNDVPRGEIGEIVYRGPTVMKEYWNKPAETADAFHGGWFHSGDMVREDEDGYYYVVDRKKDMIISGGENIYSVEVENVLAGHPKVAEVALIGVPDPKWGEIPVAVVAPRDPADPPTEDDIEQWCREHMAGYKRPRRIVLVGNLPRNPSGKVLKRTLRDEFASA